MLMIFSKKITKNNFSFTAAKDYVLNCILNGLSLSEPCDESFKDEDFRLPDWYDDEKYRR